MQTLFSYEETKSGQVRIADGGRVVTTLKGAEAVKFLNKVSSADEDGQQLLMAKATGNFKRGNEKVSKRRRK